MIKLKDEVICIGCRKYSESSQIVTLFGKAHGRIRAIAKGSRRNKSNFSGGIDLLTVGSVIFAPARGESSLATLMEYELASGFSGLRGDLLSLNCGQYGCELVGAFTEDYDPHEGLYDAFLGFLERLCCPGSSGGCIAALVGFELVLLREVGLSPTFGGCCQCGAVVSGGSRVYFSSGRGGVLCRDCEGAVMEKRYITAAALGVLQRPVLCGDADNRVILEAHEVLSYHERELLGKETATMVFVNKLLRGGGVSR